MRDPNRIDHTIETIRRVWHTVPDWRLGQLICNIGRDAGFWDPFYLEDDTLDAVATAYLKADEEERGDGVTFMMHNETYSTFQNAVEQAVKECEGRNFEIRANKDGTYSLLYETEEVPET